MIEKNANIISLGRKSKSKSPAARRAKALGHGEDVLITKHSQDGYDRAVSNSYHNTTRTYNDFAEPNTGFPPRLSTETNENVQIPLHSKT